MKNICIMTLFIILTLNTFTQAPDWKWAKSYGGLGGDYSNRLVTDSNGNLYLFGSFRSKSLEFGKHKLFNSDTTLQSYDIFIVKFDSLQNVIWAKSIKGELNEECVNIAIDKNEDLVISGIYNSPNIKFDSINLTNNEKIVYLSQIFLIKMNKDGEALWGKNLCNKANEFFTVNTYIDFENNILISGNFRTDSITFENTTLKNVRMDSSNYDIFILKYNSNGNLIWAKQAGSRGDDFNSDIKSDKSGNIYFTANSYQTEFYYSNNSIHKNIFSQDFTISKVDKNGNLIWIKSFGGDNFDFCSSISIDFQCNVYVVGGFRSKNIEVNKFKIYNKDTTRSSTDIFFLKLDSLGNSILLNSFGGEYNDYANEIIIDNNRGYYIIGDFSSNDLVFGNFKLKNNDNTKYTEDIFITKFDSNANITWSINVGSNINEHISNLCVDKYENVLITGNFDSQRLLIGNDSLINTNNSGSIPDIFIAKLGNMPSEVEEILCDERISISPNPVNNFTTISFSNDQINTTINIIDISGNILKTSSFTGKILQFEKKDLCSGMYILQIIDNKKNVYYKKLIVQ